jgi:hypothetical protein
MFARGTIHDCSPASGRVVSRHAPSTRAKIRQPVRRTIRDSADIEFVPTKNGKMTSADTRVHILAMPDSLQWDCFSFGCIPLADHFTIEFAESNDATSCCEFALVSCEM